MKIAPIIRAIESLPAEKRQVTYTLVHTGQHYDAKMSQLFFEELDIPEPTINLASGGGTQAEQTGKIMVGFEAFLSKQPTDLVIVVGDVTSTLACSIVAKKAGVKVAHVEGGIRSGDMRMPEEINRIVTDSIADYFFTTSSFANENLLKTGVSQQQIFFVGNTMIDTLLAHRHRFRQPAEWHVLGLQRQQYFVLTMHRPANVDNAEVLESYLRTFDEQLNELPIVFPVHPRTRQKINELGYQPKHLKLIEPLGYLEFNYLVEHCKAVITDSGGITEETTVLGIPCITLRDSTERPETIEAGTNVLAGTNPLMLKPYFDQIFAGRWKQGSIPPLWDGQTGKRIIDTLLEIINQPLTDPR
ncbi:MAG: UDP-N-acetylglucosamine 2-epimerase (non-hydrolyzing) [Chitinophagaceae bacterium]|jgi:UDP-N-acetylglucosamine 2-epimerase (non-hydrolysing)|nr:UDP-N-acetylglucosamine 2-epimerase (non-hydrolyzing) [Chitinophagaceae bacterium]